MTTYINKVGLVPCSFMVSKYFKETRARMQKELLAKNRLILEEILTKEAEYQRKREQENIVHGRPAEYCSMKDKARKLLLRVRTSALSNPPRPSDEAVCLRIRQDSMRLTPEERKAQHEARKKENEEKRPKKIAYVLASYALFVNIFSFSYAALGLYVGKTKSEIEKEIRYDRTYLVNGLLPINESEGPYRHGYKPKVIETHVTEETYEWIRSQPPVQPADPDCKTKIRYRIIKKDKETGKQYLENSAIEKVLGKILLLPISKPGRELAYELIKPSKVI